MPPNTSNFLQPLYRSCFTNLEMDYSCVIDEQVSTTNYNKENRTDFVTSYGISREGFRTRIYRSFMESCWSKATKLRRSAQWTVY